MKTLKQLEQAMQNKIQAQLYQTEREQAEAQGAKMFYSRNQPSSDISMDFQQENRDTAEQQKQGHGTQREEKREFHLDGTKVIPAESHGMDLSGLLSVLEVEPRCLEIGGKKSIF